MPQLVGPSDAALTGNCSANTVYYDSFEATTTGTATFVRVKCSGSGNVKAAIYSDPGGGSVGSPIGFNNTGVACVAGWNNISISAASIVDGTNYYMAFISDSAIVGKSSDSGGYVRRKEADYATWTWPTPAGSGFSGDSITWQATGWSVATKIGIGASLATSVGMVTG